MKPVVHHLNGCEKDGHHSRVQAGHHQARRKSLRGSDKTMTATETKYENETMQSTARNEYQELFDPGWQNCKKEKRHQNNTVLCTYCNESKSPLFVSKRKHVDNCTRGEFLAKDIRNEGFTAPKH